MFSAIHTGDPTPDLIAIRYLEALQGIADGQATKIFLPVDTAGVLGSVAAIGEMFKETSNGSAPAGPPRPAGGLVMPFSPRQRCGGRNGRLIKTRISRGCGSWS